MKQAGVEHKNIMTLKLRRNAGNPEERARQRGSRMGPSSGGAGMTSPFSPGGLGESSGAKIIDLPRRRRSMDEGGRQRYYDSYWNRSYSSNQRTWSIEEDHQRSSLRLRSDYGCFAVFISLAIFISRPALASSVTTSGALCSVSEMVSLKSCSIRPVERW